MDSGQVEPNHLSAQRTGQIYAQLPANANITILENGQFAKYDYENGEVNFTGDGEWLLVFNEVKLYDDRWRESYKDFAMQAKNYTPGSNTITHNGVGPLKGQMTPRLFKTNIGDIYTTNCIKVGNTDGNTEVDMGDIAVGNQLKINAQGYLAKDGTSDIIFKVVKVYTMPDGQEAVKVQRIA